MNITNSAVIRTSVIPNEERLRIRQPWVSILRAAWIALAVVTMVLFVLGIPLVYRNLTTVCEAGPCVPTSALPEEAAAFEALGLGLEGAAILRTGLTALVALSYLLMALLIFWRKSDDRAGLFFATASLTYVYAAANMNFFAIQHYFGSLFIAETMNVLGLSLIFQFVYLMPNGEYKPRWTAIPALGFVVWYITAFLFPDAPFGRHNAPEWLLNAVFMGVFVIGAYSQVYRYRHAPRSEYRQQIKWMMLGIVISCLLYVVGVGPILFLPGLFTTIESQMLSQLIGVSLFNVGVTLVPITLAISVLRYRLWDVDIIINRSLVYGAMILLMITTLLGSAYGLQALFRALTGQSSDLAVIFATFLSVLTLQPARILFQRAIDRAFFRTKLDLQEAVLDFTRDVRNIVELQELRRVLVKKSVETLVLEYGAVYLRDEDGHFILAEGSQLPDGKSTLFRPDTAQRTQLENGEALTGDATFPLILPLQTQGSDSSELIGALALGPRKSGQGYSRDDHKLLMTLAAQAGTAIHVAQLAEAQLHKLEEANRLKSEFLATMSHELRTPLHAIIGYTDVMLTGMTGELNEEQQDYEERILANADHLLKLIDDVLDIAKIEAGRMDVVKRPFAVRDWLREVVEMSKSLADQKNIAFEVVLSDHMPETILGDADRLKQIALNLISNAVKFTSKGGVRVDVTPRGKNVWGLIVTDTGIGIPPHALDYIFDEFRQVDSSASREFGGTGLGLAIVRKLALLMGGNVRVESQAGKGSAFTVLLPLTIPAGNASENAMLESEAVA